MKIKNLTLLIIATFAFNGILKSQSFVGKNLSELIKDQDYIYYYVHKDSPAKLVRTIIVSSTRNFYTYVDNKGVIKIQLPEGYSFLSDDFMESLILNLIISFNGRRMNFYSNFFI
jgi:hypothetical protein